jgi:hypothetical protein
MRTLKGERQQLRSQQGNGMIAHAPSPSSEMKTAAEKPEQANDDQIDGNDIVQQTGHN